MKLHWTTLIVLALGVIQLVTSFWSYATSWDQIASSPNWTASYLGFLLNQAFSAVAYALGWFIAAAVLEYLHRIWTELKRGNELKSTSCSLNEANDE